ncbi:MAG: DUF411 domain-containing protein [Gemmatimonadaceae bacterium]
MADVTPAKDQHGVPHSLRTCHTAVVNGYVIEGHVPPEDIRRLLREKPAVAGIGVAGMPRGSPGMEQGATKDPYSVIAWLKDGSTSVYARH